MNSEQEIVNVLQSKLKQVPKIALVLGSGWNRVVEDAKIIQKFKFDDLFGVEAGVEGHLGELIVAEIENKLAFFMCGRWHTYEGYSAYEVTLPVRVFARLGVKSLVLTSAVGALNENYKVGDIVILKDIITLFMPSPLTGTQFQDLSEPFDFKLRELAVTLCKKEKIACQQGVHVAVPGPHYESFADKKMLSIVGADVVGMSLVPSAIMARRLGLKTLGLSCATNLAFVKHSHKEVIAEAKRVSADMLKLLKGVIKNHG